MQVDKAYLSTLSGEKVSQVDSIASAGRGRFRFSLDPRKHRAGICRLSFDKSKWADFVVDGKDVTIVTDAGAVAESLKVISSESNELYYSFLRLNKQYKTRSELLQLVLARYPKDDSYYAITQSTATELQNEYAEFISTKSQKAQTSFVARYIRSAQLPVVDFTLPPEKQLSHLKAHALDHVDFTDDGLIYSDLFTSKAIEYLTYYRNPQLPKELLEKEFTIAVDTILNKARVNPVVYQHITEYLIDGFKKFGFEKCIGYILDNYVIKDDLCLNENQGSSIRRMIEQKKRLPVGAAVPDIVLPDSSGNAISLLGMNADKILILFYSSSCPHCQAMIPRLAEQYKNTLSVFAVSLDSSRTDWLNFIRTHKLNWVNVNDPLGWEGKTASDYSVYATPTMILVDKDKKVISKPLTIDELKKSL